MSKILNYSLLCGVLAGASACQSTNDTPAETITIIETVTVVVTVTQTDSDTQSETITQIDNESMTDTSTDSMTETDTGSMTQTNTQTQTNTESTTDTQTDVNSQCIGEIQESGYCLLWQDEFQEDTLDESKWSYERNCWGGGNAEAQCYVQSPENLWVDGEYLRIQAKREDATGPAFQDDQDGYDINDTSGSGDYTSARIRTLGKGDWAYGKIEVRAKLPFGQGTWPAIWMLPSEGNYDGIWAINGEIDIMETVNLKVDGEQTIHGTLHYGDEYPKNVYSGEEYELPGGASPADDFHTYTIEWEEGEIRWYVDGDHFATQQSAGWYTQGDLEDPHAPFNQAFHIILNFAVGGEWAANVNDKGIDESVFPQELAVDYVRVYGCTHDFETGKGCASVGENFALNEGKQPPEEVVVGETDWTSGEEVLIYIDQLEQPLDYGSFPNDTVSLNSVAELGYGFVAELEYLADNSAAFFFFSNFRGSTGNENISGFDAIEFEYRITQDTREVKDNIYFRADCTYPCTSGSYDIGYPALNEWQFVSIAIDDLAELDLNPSNVNVPFAIYPEVGNQMGVIIQVDNVKVVKVAGSL
ncbi:family 16 glycosylhydrolase [Marinicellulosiphila megalodicopiae]|uniref:family 16 glycosylhydrolase n=1 Tax=Marinicellulosiphila megalodicopiae TaxID=2724896 RepID=UPI003BB0931C